MLRRRWPIILFLGWTAYVWITRLVNVWSVSDESSLAKVISTVFAVGLLAAAVVGAIVLVGARSRSLSEGEATFFGWFGAATCAIWAGRMVQIAFDDTRDMAFKEVHLGLGIVSVILAVVTMVLVRAEQRRGEGVESPMGAPSVEGSSVEGPSVEGSSVEDSPVEGSSVEDSPVEGSLVQNLDG
jgi:hypothetical protein